MSRRSLDELTRREQEVLALIARRMTNGEIADELNISFDTAKSHVSNILSKLGVDTREEAAAVWRDVHSIRARVLAIPAALLHLGLLQRVLIGVAAVACVGGLAVGVGLGTGTIDVSSPPPTITVPLSELLPGKPIAVQSNETGHDQFGDPYPVLVARQDDGSIKAFLGRDPTSNCPVSGWRQTNGSLGTSSEPELNLMNTHPGYGFVAKCSGWVFLLNGVRIFGGAPRGLDQYPVTIRGDNAVVHLGEVILGQCTAVEGGGYAHVTPCSVPGAAPILVAKPPSSVIYHWGLPDQIPPPVAPPTPRGPATSGTVIGDAQTTAVTVRSEDIFFDHTNIIVAANQKVTITYDNEDANVPHNFELFQGSDAGGTLEGKTEIAGGPDTQTLTVTLKPGTYHFDCQVHPDQMKGTIAAR